jgi:hypothetical protein
LPRRAALDLSELGPRLPPAPAGTTTGGRWANRADASRARPRAGHSLVDRSLGVKLAGDLQALGFVVHRLEPVYGAERAPVVEDTEWLNDAGRLGWLVLTKDKRIRSNRLERERIVAAGARVVCLTSGSLTGDRQRAIVIIHHIHRIVARGARPGPFVYALSERGLVLH